VIGSRRRRDNTWHKISGAFSKDRILGIGFDARMGFGMAETNIGLLH
jgi:hypothetical protein